MREQLVKVQEDTAATIKAVQQQQEEMTKAPRVAARPKKPAKAATTSSSLDPLLSNDALLAAPEPSAPTDGKSALYHQVKPGETLFKISKRYNVQMKSLRTWNRLENDQLEVGQKLVVGYE